LITTSTSLRPFARFASNAIIMPLLVQYLP
jgi:hypothetical protein